MPWVLSWGNLQTHGSTSSHGTAFVPWVFLSPIHNPTAHQPCRGYQIPVAGSAKAEYDDLVSHVKRLLVTDRVFFITVNLRKNCVKFEETEYPLLITAMEESRAKLGSYLFGYVLMPDHWHALIGVKQPVTISRAVQDIKWISARHINRHRFTSGPLWQHQFWDRFVRHEKEFTDRLAYIHVNPVKKQLAGHPKDWPWSSYSNFAVEPELRNRCLIRMDAVRFAT